MKLKPALLFATISSEDTTQCDIGGKNIPLQQGLTTR